MSVGMLAPRAQGRGLSGVEVLVKWGDRTLERAFVDGQQRRGYTLGGAGCDFYAHPRWLGAAALEVVSLRGGEAVVHGREGALERGQEARWDFGPLTLEARWAVAPPPKVIPLAERLDYLQLNVLVAVAAVAALGIGAAVTGDLEGDGFDDGLAPAEAQRLIRMVVRPEPNQPKPTKVASESAEAGAPKAPGREGASGTPSQERRPGRAAPGRGSDTDKAREAISRMFSGKSLAGLTGGTGLGSALNVALGGVERSVACAGPACNGLGIRGDGSGGGGLERDLGSVGLQTQGRAGRNFGYGRGPSLSKGLGMGMIPCLKDATGKCQDPGPEITRDETVVCGEKGAEGLGCLDKELIRRVIRSNLGGVRACYQHALTRKPTIEGKVSVKFTIGLEGNVPASALAQSTVADSPLEACVVDRMRTLQFPRSRGVAVVTYPFIFHQAGR